MNQGTLNVGRLPSLQYWHEIIKVPLQAINFNDLFFSEKRLYTLCSLQIQTFYWEKVNSTVPRKYLFNELDNMKTNKAELPKFTVNEKR